jgi:hypothetical protein
MLKPVAAWLAILVLAVANGRLWLGLTLAFEFGFGGIVQRQSWNEMLGQYAFRDGDTWPIVLAITFFAPLIASRGRRVRFTR